MIAVNELQHIQIFRDFVPEDLAKTIPCLTEKTFLADETIIYRGDPGYSMFFILSGTVIITLKNDEGIDYTISTLQQGDNFGEMALITGAPRSANVKAVTDVRLAELSQEAFLELITSFPKLFDDFLRQLAQRRAQSVVRGQFENLERTEIITSLFSQQPPDIDALLGKTKWTSDTNTSIDRLAATESNVLILGERGTGKDLAARLIHFHSQAKSRPLLHLDCANPPPIHRDSGQGQEAVKDELHLELAQESALFGHGLDAGSYSRGIRKGYLELANDGAIVLENIDSLSSHMQQLLIQYIKDGAFVRAGDNQKIASKTRIIATVTRTLEGLKNQGDLDPELLTLISCEILPMKPLRERKKDIPILAEHLLQKYNKKFMRNVKEFSKEALNSLVDHDWPLNIDEMHQVLERAVVIADGETLTERQVFLNPPTFSSTGKFNLLKIPFIRELANHKFIPGGLRIVTIPFILALIILTLVGPPQKNPANLVVWAIWWPFLIFSIFISARSWCGYCPLPSISDGLNFYRKRFFSVPEFIEKNGIWIGIIGFALILLAEHVTHMFTAARATSALLLSILAGTFIINFLFGKRSWCKYFCPLGRMVANSSVISLVELGSNSNVCSSQCQTHDCIKEGNCPMGLHPSAAAVSKDCILCLSCLKRCKHQSVRIDVRLPWYEFYAKEKWNLSEAFFAVTLTAMVLAVGLPSWGPLTRIIELQQWENPFIVDITLSIMVALFFYLSVLIASGLLNETSWKKYFAITGSTYLFLAFASFFNIYLHQFVYNGQNLFPWILEMSGLSGAIPNEWITPNLGTLKAVIPIITLISCFATLSLLCRLSKKYDLPAFVRKAHQGIILITTLIFLIVL